MIADLIKLVAATLEPFAAAKPAVSIALLLFSIFAIVVSNADKLAQLLEVLDRLKRRRRS